MELVSQSKYAKQLSAKVEWDDLVGGVYLLPPKRHPAERICRELVRCLREDCRMTLTVMSRRTGIPVSTLHDHLKRLRQHYHLRLALEPQDRGST